MQSVIVETEEEIFSCEEINNGSNPLWCTGSSCLARVDGDVFATGLELIPGKPHHISSCRWLLYHKKQDAGWNPLYRDKQPTREPAPLICFPNGKIFIFAHPSIRPLESEIAESQLVEFDRNSFSQPTQILSPAWNDKVSFSHHSYRNIAVDGENQEIIIFVNHLMDRAYWSFRDRNQKWKSHGEIFWPWGDTYENPQPIRLCYNNTFLKNKAVFILGTSDITEPVKAWKEYRYKVTNREWDYEFRRLFFSWTPDITKENFRPWIEIASREATAGKARNCDLWVDAQELAHVLWHEISADINLRDVFFPNERIIHSIHYGIIKNGKLIHHEILAQGGEGISDEEPSWARWHVSTDNHLFAIIYVGGKNGNGRTICENRLVSINDSSLRPSILLPLKFPFVGCTGEGFFTATPRCGTTPSNIIDMMGKSIARPEVIRYARLRLQG